LSEACRGHTAHITEAEYRNLHGITTLKVLLEYKEKTVRIGLTTSNSDSAAS
jgi:hypothetical protein